MPRLARKKVCGDCPFRREARPGWLGAEDDPEEFVKGALADYADFPLPCHTNIDYSDPDWLKTQYPTAPLCAGALIFAKNRGKLPRDPERGAWVHAVESDLTTVFATPQEFIQHHTGR